MARTIVATIVLVLEVEDGQDPADAVSTYLAENGVPDPMVEDV